MHTIRLRGPWQLLVEGQAPVAMQLPNDDWVSVADRRRSVRLVRFFNCPTGLESQEVYLAIRFAPGRGQVTLNQQQLGPVDDKEPARFAVTQLLAARNELTIDVDDVSGDGQSRTGVCDVQLEIE